MNRLLVVTALSVGLILPATAACESGPPPVSSGTIVDTRMKQDGFENKCKNKKVTKKINGKNKTTTKRECKSVRGDDDAQILVHAIDGRERWVEIEDEQLDDPEFQRGQAWSEN